MATVFEDGKLCDHTCCEHVDQKMKIHKRTETNFYALCPVCNPTFDPEEMHMYDCFCSTCSDFIFAIDEPTTCFMCGRLACGACMYVDDDFTEPVCGVCSKKVNTAEFDDEYREKLQAARAEREARRKARQDKRKANRK